MALTAKQVMAIAADNPLIIRQMELDIKLRELRVLESNYRQDRYKLEDAINIHLPADIALLKENITILKGEIALRDAHKRDETDKTGKTSRTIRTDAFVIRLGDSYYDERKIAGELILKALASGKYLGRDIGSYQGFSIRMPELSDCKLVNFSDSDTLAYVDKPNGGKTVAAMPSYIYIVGNARHKVQLSSDPVGSMIRLENDVKDFDKDLRVYEQRLEAREQNLIAAREQFTKPFDHTEELESVLTELEGLNMQLNVETDAELVPDEPEDGEDEAENGGEDNDENNNENNENGEDEHNENEFCDEQEEDYEPDGYERDDDEDEQEY